MPCVLFLSMPMQRIFFPDDFAIKYHTHIHALHEQGSRFHGDGVAYTFILYLVPVVPGKLTRLHAT